jgi:pimeloyl-ACP methyl ester carboxylesterase
MVDGRALKSAAVPNLAIEEERAVTGLHMDFSGPESGTPLVLLHGFGGDGSAWDAVKAELPGTRCG